MNPKLGLTAVGIVVMALSGAVGPYGMNFPAVGGAQPTTDTPEYTVIEVGPGKVTTEVPTRTKVTPSTDAPDETRWPPGNNPVPSETATRTATQTPTQTVGDSTSSPTPTRRTATRTPESNTRTAACDRVVTEYVEFTDERGTQIEGTRYLTPRDCGDSVTPTPKVTVTFEDCQTVRIEGENIELIHVTERVNGQDRPMGPFIDPGSSYTHTATTWGDGSQSVITRILVDIDGEPDLVVYSPCEQ